MAKGDRKVIIVVRRLWSSGSYGAAVWAGGGGSGIAVCKSIGVYYKTEEELWQDFELNNVVVLEQITRGNNKPYAHWKKVA